MTWFKLFVILSNLKLTLIVCFNKKLVTTTVSTSNASSRNEKEIFIEPTQTIYPHEMTSDSRLFD